MRTGCVLGHVFAAFSGPKEYTARELLDEQDIGGCLSIRLNEWFRMPESCTFADWLSAEAHRMQHYYIDQQGQLTRFIIKPWSEYITGFFTVRVATAVLNETPYNDFHRSGEQTIAMCIVLELSANAPAEDSCRLYVRQQMPTTQWCTRNSLQLLNCSKPTSTGHTSSRWRSRIFEQAILTITEDISCLEGGYIVMQTVQCRRQIRVNLPRIHFEAVSAVDLAINRSKLLHTLGYPSPNIRIYH